MCGIAGIAHQGGLPTDATRVRLQRMADSMVHRGPDDEGLYLGHSVGLAARRLAIIDVAGGHQPVHNENRTVWAALNGEVFNHQDLRRDLGATGHRLRSSVDTEVLVHLWEEYGERMPSMLRGIFAFAVADETSRELVVCRDRLGVKPLYYAHTGNVLVFASEAKAILQTGLVDAIPDQEALDLLLTLGYVPAPRTMFKGVLKLPPAHFLRWRDGQLSVKRYWNFPTVQNEGSVRPSEWCDEFGCALGDAVSAEMMSDVPLGVMLSGGFDSSAVAALAQSLDDNGVKTFHVAFGDGSSGSELEDARLVSRHLGTEHCELVASSDDTLESLARVAWHMDEPVSDLSALGFYQVCGLARKHVTVALAGQGADELLAGYRRYVAYEASRPLRLLLPQPGADLLARAAAALPRAQSLKKLAATLGRRDFLDWYIESISIGGASLKSRLIRSDCQTDDPCGRLRCVLESHLAGFDTKDGLSGLLLLDSVMALPDDLLLYFDKMSMAHSLEVRVPFLDHRLVELCTRMPKQMKLRRTTTKYVLRDAMRSVLPRRTLRKPKRGFHAHLVDAWARGDGRTVVNELLAGDGVRCLSMIDPRAVKELIEAHMSGRENYGRQLVNLCMLELWFQQHVDGSLTRQAPGATARNGVPLPGPG